MRFEADLDLVVDGTRAHVSADGARLVVDAADPARLVKALRRTTHPTSRRQLATIADGLAAHGASMRLQGPHGHVVTVGADADAAALSVLTGSRHVAPGSGRGVLSLAKTIKRPRWRPLAVAAAATATVIVLARRLAATAYDRAR